ncbi:hypothetical protein, partial [Stenotrophomonas sp. SrG]|uniref:hypothetical protein n=1 Tax=Stenotrophomonas sp. SrG TaxID=3414430 RepID=UPI003CF117F2
VNLHRGRVAGAAAAAGGGALSAASALRVDRAFDLLDTGTGRGPPGWAVAAGALLRVQGAAGLEASLDSLSGMALILANG